MVEPVPPFRRVEWLSSHTEHTFTESSLGDVPPSYTLVVLFVIDGGQDGRIKGFRLEEAPNSCCIGLPRVKRLLRRNLARSCGKRHCQQVRQRNSCDPISFPYLSTGSLCRKIPPPWVSPVAIYGLKQDEDVSESDSYIYTLTSAMILPPGETMQAVGQISTTRSYTTSGLR